MESERSIETARARKDGQREKGIVEKKATMLMWVGGEPVSSRIVTAKLRTREEEAYNLSTLSVCMF